MSEVPSARPRLIVILGGGTAGWMAAMLFQHRWGASGTRVILVESKDIGIIGVGEGSTPQLKAFFDELGIAEREWMPRCNATYKSGIEFADWSSQAGFARYFHPFPTAVDAFTAPAFFHNAALRRAGHDVEARPDPFFVPARLASDRQAPVAPPNFPFVTTYGYHFDAYLVGDFLRERAIARGVKRPRTSAAQAAASLEAVAAEPRSPEPVKGAFLRREAREGEERRG